MIFKYPNKKKNNDIINIFPILECTSIKHLIVMGAVTVGSKIVVDGKDITCIHHEGNEWFFQYDDCFINSSGGSEALGQALEKVWNEIIPDCLKREIQYVFIPTEFQVFGKNLWGKKENDDYQFDYYKDNEAHHVKNYRGLKDNAGRGVGKTCYWWLSTEHDESPSDRCIVGCDGHLGYCSNGDSFGIPICFCLNTDVDVKQSTKFYW